MLNIILHKINKSLKTEKIDISQLEDLISDGYSILDISRLIDFTGVINKKIKANYSLSKIINSKKKYFQ